MTFQSPVNVVNRTNYKLISEFSLPIPVDTLSSACYQQLFLNDLTVV